MKKPSLVNIFVFILNNIFALALLGSYLAWFINPSKLPIAGVVALGVPVLIGINFLFIIYWLILRKKQFFLSTFCLLLGWWHFNALYQFSPTNKTKENSEFIRVMSYNVRVFHFPGPYKWHASPPGIEKMADSLKPDIFCMQEFLEGGNWVPNFKLEHKYVSNSKGLSLAIYSNYKMFNKGAVSYPDKTGRYGQFIYADILRGTDTVRIINVHLISFRLDNKDLQTFTQIENADEEKVKRSAAAIYTRLTKAYQKRGLQVNTIVDFVANSPYPVILCGDFNDTPTSYTYRKFTSLLNDSYRLAGSGIGTTHTRFDHYNVPVRIDHILADETLIPFNWHVIKKDYSDHYPVVVDYEFQ